MATKKTKREPTARVTHTGRGVLGALQEILAGVAVVALQTAFLCDHCEMMENMYDV